MISIKINDKDNFMNSLIVGHLFDDFNMTECSVNTFIKYSIDGKLNKDYFDEETDNDFILWKDFKSIFTSLIRGNRAPSKIKLVLSLSPLGYNGFINSTSININPDNISGLYMNINYDDGGLNIITATSQKVFTMSKDLDIAWDNTVESIFKKNFDVDIL